MEESKGMFLISYHWDVDGSDVYTDLVDIDELQGLKEEQGFILISQVWVDATDN